ncbi:3-oxoacyl-ACP synthase III family protein [Ekhidna sp.]|uniref:3-oxoacyl-ACP synthase III family protein n=1 Tax=Ekhidna sp. TaxID=2608089 RepID=UPI003C7DF32B
MIGIKAIGTYLPHGIISNFDLMEKHGIDEYFIKEKIGFESVSRKDSDEDTSDLAVKAIENLLSNAGVSKSDLDCLVLITQNPDLNIPHTSAIVHGKLELPRHCACWDVSLGCSGFVHGLAIAQSFMQMNGLTNGLLVTADPYSKIMDPEDKNTSLLFGDGATATLLSTESPKFEIGKFTFGTIGKDHQNLICHDHTLSMNGRAIFNFAAKNIPKDVKSLLEKNELELVDVDRFIFHQGSKYLVDTLVKRIGLDASKVPFDATEYGNIVSSSIPYILEKEFDTADKTYLISGFGVGLSWSSTILKKL